jgi:hypothetical protein
MTKITILMKLNIVTVAGHNEYENVVKMKK